MRILTIDDESATRRLLRRHLESQQWKVEEASTYEKGVEKMISDDYDVVICDYHISPGAQTHQGIDLIREVRSHKVNTPVIFLTGRGLDEITPSDALDIGVDDFMRKPWNEKELISRIKAVVRRSFACDQNSTNILEQGPIKLDLDYKTAEVYGKEVQLGSTIALVLQKFLQRPDSIQSHEDFVNYLWGFPVSSVERAEKINCLRVHINHLKNALGLQGAAHIRTIHGTGYVWQTEVGPESNTN